jgi:RES domain-containing protein
VDLTDPATLGALGIAPDDLLCLWKDMASRGIEPPTWRIQDQLLAEDVHGVRVPSAANPCGVNFVMWRLDNAPGRRVNVVDPDSALPVDQASWPAVRGPSSRPP